MPGRRFAVVHHAEQHRPAVGGRRTWRGIHLLVDGRRDKAAEASEERTQRSLGARVKPGVVLGLDGP